MTGHPALETSALSVAAGRRVLARDVNLLIRPGEVHAVMGASGSGKSTLLWTVLGLVAAAAGEVRIAGEPMTARHVGRAAAIRRRHTGIVYQQPGLVDELSVVENVAVPLMLTRGSARPEAEQTASALLRRLGVDPAARTHELSGGEAQRVSVARATAGSPALVVADEPTAALDEQSAATVMTCIVDEVRQRGGALLMVTHDSRVAARADVLWDLADGLLTARG